MHNNSVPVLYPKTNMFFIHNQIRSMELKSVQSLFESLPYKISRWAQGWGHLNFGTGSGWNFPSKLSPVSIGLFSAEFSHPNSSNYCRKEAKKKDAKEAEEKSAEEEEEVIVEEEEEESIAEDDELVEVEDESSDVRD